MRDAGAPAPAGAATVRVIAGSAKGRRLRAIDKPSMRPTTDMARQTIFDILGDRVVDARVLDLFAGAGTLGIEALSRGASHATLVDDDRDACAIIAANLDACGFAPLATVRRADVARFLARKPQTPFDLVFLDPPYAAGLGFAARVIQRLAAGGWVRSGGTVVAEAEVGQLDWPSGFRETRTKRFGRTQVRMAVCDDDTNGGISRDL